MRALEGRGSGVDGRGARDVEREDRQARERGGGGGAAFRCLGLGRERGERGCRRGVAAGGDDGVESPASASSQDELAGELEAQALCILFGF